MNYIPDNWVVLRIEFEGNVTYKVLAGWSGGYTTGDSWKLNSGITHVTEDENFYYFYGHSGSCYQCHKEYYELRANNSHAYLHFKELLGDKLTVLPSNTDWLNLNYTGERNSE